MADQRMSEEDYEAYTPYIDEIIQLINQHIRRHPDPHVLGEAWRIGYVTVLTDIVRVCGLLPQEMDSYLGRVCAAIIEDTKANVRQWDAEGPPRP